MEKREREAGRKELERNGIEQVTAHQEDRHRMEVSWKRKGRERETETRGQDDSLPACR